MTTIPLIRSPPPPSSQTTTTTKNPLPPLLRTPSGLAILELQGTINFPPPSDSSDTTIKIGRLIFPEYDPDQDGESEGGWMKRVYMYVGEHQRLMGEVRKLPRPFGVVSSSSSSRRGEGEGDGGDGKGDGDGPDGRGVEVLEVVEVVRYKLVFGSRPEPVTGTSS
ncbi:chromosome transmission fidelity protein 8 [Echria macrotheca]|uniref:Chromosome transmission fidelity protein 8 n=1 Tax=Echria macrotheca TaxID=438768 RepID=A0AAJ0BNS8_9PEZI|nr:chromosome transmission fidelity protein 8 [Echria macrotheca]